MMGQNTESDIRTALHAARNVVKQLEYALANATGETPKPRTPTPASKDHVWTAAEQAQRGNVKQLRKLAETKALEVKHAATQCERCGRYNYDLLTVCCGA